MPRWTSLPFHSLSISPQRIWVVQCLAKRLAKYETYWILRFYTSSSMKLTHTRWWSHRSSRGTFLDIKIELLHLDHPCLFVDERQGINPVSLFRIGWYKAMGFISSIRWRQTEGYQTLVVKCSTTRCWVMEKQLRMGNFIHTFWDVESKKSS